MTKWFPSRPPFLRLQVKADKDSANLQRLQQASRGVTQATAAVVASTKSGKSQIEETGERRDHFRLFIGNLKVKVQNVCDATSVCPDTMDFSSMTLTQIKRQEMDAQVRKCVS